MATTYKKITTNDTVSTRTLLHEAVPVTGTIVSGTYGEYLSERNIKNYTHGMFQSVYDYPYLSSSSNHIFDITCGYDEASPLSGTTNRVQNSKKINLYNQFAQLLLGYTSSTADSIKKFESDLSLDGVNSMKDVFFVSFSRLLSKDQVKRNSFSLTLGTGSWDTPWTAQLTLSDKSASYGTNGGVKNVIGGDYGVLYGNGQSSDNAYGVVFYQAGIAVLSSSCFKGVTDFNKLLGFSYDVEASLSGSAISQSCNALRHRLKNISYNNTTEINSSIYFCRVPHNEYNYSSNPTYVSGSKIRVKNKESDDPVAYITTVGLYNTAGELLAVAKLSEPLRKDPTNDITIRVRLDY